MAQPDTADDPSRTALVLAGGGARGAYEVGVVQGIVEALGPGRTGAPFRIFAGTSVGAINAAFFAAHADRPDLAVNDLAGRYAAMRIDTHLRTDLRGFFGLRHTLAERDPGARYGRALLDPRPLEQLVGDGVPWRRLRTNVSDGAVRALVVSATRIADGRTVMFADAGEQAIRSSAEPHREVVREHVTREHVLASAALPLLFPARRIAGTFYCDGGVRMNTPIAPAIRAGARRIVVVTLRPPPPPLSEEERNIESYPNPVFLLGKLLDALLVDAVDHDLDAIRRINRLIEVASCALPPEGRARFVDMLATDRRAPYCPIETLVFRPTLNLAELARVHVRSGALPTEHRLTPFFLRRAATAGALVDADLLSYLLFDGSFATQLLLLGKRDALARAAEIRAFFAPPAEGPACEVPPRERR